MTKRQRDLLSFIRDFIEENGYAPSFPEMMEAIGASSKSGIYRLLTSLEEQGFIRRLHNRARAIEVVDNPHIPAGMSVGQLATEARRIGMALCYVHYDDKGQRSLIPTTLGS